MIGNLKSGFLSLRLDEAYDIPCDSFEKKLLCDIGIIADSDASFIKDLHILLLASVYGKVVTCDFDASS